MKAKFEGQNYHFKIKIIISNLVNVLNIFSIHFATYLMNERVFLENGSVCYTVLLRKCLGSCYKMVVVNLAMLGQLVDANHRVYTLTLQEQNCLACP